MGFPPQQPSCPLATALSFQQPSPFVIPSEAEGSAVPRSLPGNVFRQSWLIIERYEVPMATITELPKTSLTLEQILDRLAQVAVNVGLGLERGQELVMTATLEALPLARLITEQAYKAG